jgi:hypothetical protein
MGLSTVLKQVSKYRTISKDRLIYLTDFICLIWRAVSVPGEVIRWFINLIISAKHW